eukprot:XP_025015489.1 uncharacterized protein LOC112536827 [Ricinus communis]
MEKPPGAAGPTYIPAPLWPRKLKLPVFEGENPDGWIFRAERYFDINNIPVVDRLKAASVCLEGDALAWFQWEEGRRPFRSWVDFKESLIVCFRSTQEGTLHDQLLALKQTTTVKEFRRQFEIIAAPLKGLAEDVLEAAFVNGLRPDMQAELRQWSPFGLDKKMQVAQKIEEKLKALGQYNQTTQNRWANSTPSGTHFTNKVTQVSTTPSIKPNHFPKSFTSSSNSTVAKPSGSVSTSTGSNNTRPPFKQMSHGEMEACRLKGLYYRCDGRYDPGHRCPNKSLKILCVINGSSEEEEMTKVEQSKEIPTEEVQADAP